MIWSGCTVVVLNTGAGIKYPNTARVEALPLQPESRFRV
ncbi:hypothetical protein M2277_002275 [Paenibacillus sp. LBL]|nr:hypothetical protein [Paenibacillus sp. LBL]